MKTGNVKNNVQFYLIIISKAFKKEGYIKLGYIIENYI